MAEQKTGKLGRVLSYASNRSKKSASQNQSQGFGHARKKTDSSDTTTERPSSRKMRTHADPTLAMSEAQPATIALQESSLGQLRGVQHKDRFGNLITEPDLSNPTRYRFERPLDTIKSFEAAIDGTYGSRRMSYARPDESTNGYSRPTSFFGGDRSNMHYQRGGYDSYHGSRGYQSRPESYIDGYGDQSQFNYSNQRPYRARRNSPRTNSDPNYTQNPSNPYNSQPQYQNQNENPNSNSPSGSGNRSVDHWMNSTDPSSVNSSVDRLQQQLHQQQPQGQPKYEDHPPSGETYGFSGFGTDPQLDQSQASFLNQRQTTQPSDQRPQEPLHKPQPAAPGVPPKDATNLAPSAAGKAAATPQDEKRKSWFKRRLSRF
ncbi:uncharacterized protein GIQ15_01891 [Arthroderma uncinatum]|uniref:uncharacterized protein n=1 Tax=Arthroderma uncinatum TaxID=74035 RepID=UPI00144ADFAF|nr:uncharacterized protein GIQ15_01891 [Arthroderma uncinatum]KAF3492374.1 hypothetical protein GIQ15_01891 [Arthroderma uncinatum]